MAVLDGRFGALAAHWPPVVAALIERAASRSRSLALRLAIAQEPNACDRLLKLLTHLADRWGRVGPDGVVIPLRLSQEVLADLIAARRQSVCGALGELRREGLVALRSSGHLVLIVRRRTATPPGLSTERRTGRLGLAPSASAP